MRTNFQNPLQVGISASVSQRGAARAGVIARDAFSRSLATATRSLVRPSPNTPATATTSRATSRLLRTTPLSTNSSKSVISQKTHVVTPFGTYDITIPDETSPTQATDPPDAWRDYFCTHQPHEWCNDSTARQHFAQIYGDKALVTLDYTGTVPENVESVWVTHVPLDASGKPIPKV